MNRAEELARKALGKIPLASPTADHWINNAARAIRQREAETRECLAEMMIRQSLSTGHGDTIEDLVRELEPQIAALRQREAEIWEEAARALR